MRAFTSKLGKSEGYPKGFADSCTLNVSSKRGVSIEAVGKPLDKGFRRQKQRTRHALAISMMIKRAKLSGYRVAG